MEPACRHSPCAAFKSGYNLGRPPQILGTLHRQIAMSSCTVEDARPAPSPNEAATTVFQQGLIITPHKRCFFFIVLDDDLGDLRDLAPSPDSMAP
jgi:hypothetical protein